MSGSIFAQGHSLLAFRIGNYRELEKRRIPVLTDVTHCYEELFELAQMFGDKKLEEIVTQIVAEESKVPFESAL